MADSKITQLTAITTVDTTDVLPIVDLTDVTTKKVTIAQISAQAPVQSVASKTGAVTLVKGDVGLGNVDNTSDADKPVSTATQTALNAKQDTLVSGTNIKTINSTSILGSGNIVISGGGTPSGVSGAIQFSDGSAFASDATNFFWDNTNKRLGIGTNTPAFAIDSANDSRFNGVRVGRGAGNAASNTALGGSALNANTTGVFNTCVGFQSGLLNTTGQANTSLGNEALQLTQAGSNNTAIGKSALKNNSSGSGNVSLGFRSGENNTASNNTALGTQALQNNTSGTGLVAVGYQALSASTGNNNTALGFQAGNNITTGVGNVCLGSGAMPQNATDSNKFVVGSASVNAGAVTTETITPDTTWTVRINGANYKIPMLAI